MTVQVKEWKAGQIDMEAKRFNTWCDVEYDQNDVAIIGRYVNVELLKETEKAYQFKLSSGSVVGSVKGWTTWVPKSAVVEII